MFQKVCEFFRANKLMLHPEKTKYMIFDTTGGRFSYNDVKIFLDCNNTNSTFIEEAKKRELLAINQNSSTPAITFLGIFVHTTNRRYDLPKREYGDFTCFITMK
jgi:hypothetical protein